MPVRYDPLLCRSLAREIGERHGDRRLRDLLLDRDRRAATLRLRDGPALLALLHPEAGQLLESTAARGQPAADLRGHRLGPVRAPEDERLLVLELPPGGPEGTSRRLVLELHTNQWNLLLLREELEGWRIETVLWPREPGARVLRPGRSYRPPRGARRWTDEAPSEAQWLGLLAGVPVAERRSAALRKVAWMSAVNVDHVLGEALHTDDPGALSAALSRYRDLRDARPEAWLLEEAWGLQPYVRSLEREGAERLPSLLAGMAASLRAEEAWADYAGGSEAAGPGPPAELVELREALESRASTLRRRIEALGREKEEGGDPGDLRGVGDLLLARLREVERGRERVELEGFDGEPRTVELDPGLSPSENAARYYEEAARRERALQKIPVEAERAEGRLDRIREALEALRESSELPGEEELDGLWRLAGGRPREGKDAGEEAERLPYRRLVTSGGLEVRVGRGAKSNEELTFHHSHTEDVWLHARQVPGAHVVLRWGHREGNPPRNDLLQAAVAAAVHSDARHSGSVAVDWTRRKYVRSPRKSKPGVVVPGNVQTLFVEPDEAMVERMRRRAEGD